VDLGALTSARAYESPESVTVVDCLKIDML